MLLLPADPDASAGAIARTPDRPLSQDFLRSRIGVVITDSFGRPWRRGTVGVAIGVAGLPALSTLRGKPRPVRPQLSVSVAGFADEVAAAASLLQGQAAEGQPAVLVRGLPWEPPATSVKEMVRPPDEDLFQ